MRKMLVLFVVGWTFLGAGLASGSVLNFASISNSTITFDGTADTFDFRHGLGAPDFQITSVIGATDPNTLGLFGNILGTFTIGSISSFPGIQTAPVSGAGDFTIVDEASKLFAANIQWLDIITVGIGGIINVSGEANLTNITYFGSNADLHQFVDGGAGSSGITFQFSTITGLSTLTKDGDVHSTSYSGSAAPVPEPATLLLLGSGLTALGLMRLKKK